jgi:hypothetical protein
MNDHITDQDIIEGLRTKGFAVTGPGTRPTKGTKVFNINGQDIDEMFALQLLAGASFEEVQIRRNQWLSGN